MKCRNCGAAEPSEQWYIGERPVPFCRGCWNEAVAGTGLEGQPAVEAAFSGLCAIVGEEIDAPLRKDVLLRPPPARMVMVAERPSANPPAPSPMLWEALSQIPLHHCPVCCPDPDTVTSDPEEHEKHAMSLQDFTGHMTACVATHPERFVLQPTEGGR